jgi:uncharacterized protein YebE (UPF0316 family)
MGKTEEVGVVVLLASTSWFSDLTLPLFIFLAEVAVVTLCTMRTIFISRRRKFLAPLLGLVEVSIWLFAIGQVMRNLSDLRCYLAFAGGFTIGNFLGILLEKKLAIGNLVVNVISHRDAAMLIESLKLAKYGVTAIGAQGAKGPVQVVTTVIKRKELGNVLSLIKQFDAKAFYSVNEIQAAESGIFPETKNRLRGAFPGSPKLFRTAA